MSVAESIPSVREEGGRVRRALPFVLLGAVTALAGVLDFWSLTRNGTGNDFYAAAVRSMLESWSNFFFASFDPTGWVTVDKPPLAFWIQAASAKLFGYSSLALLGPSAVAGAASVALLGRTVWRTWGWVAGVVAALVLALTPVALVVNRSNNPDAILVLTLVLAAWAGIRALESGRLRWVVLAAAFLGLGFNVKMLAAYLVLPGLGLAYLLCAHRTWRIRLAHLAAAAGVLLVITFSWMTAVDLTPASQRPYVDNSQDNTAVGLAFGYNGLERVLGGAFGRGGGVPGAGRSFRDAARGFAKGPGGGDVPGGGRGPRGGQGFPGGGGSAFGGPAGITRLLTGNLAGQGSWLLPLAVVGAVSALIAVGVRRRDVRLGSLIVFAGWVGVVFVVFSWSSGIFHPYYVAELAPGVAALVGIGVVAMWRDVLSRTWRVLLPVVALVGTAAFEYSILAAYPDQLPGWGPVVIVVSAATAVVVAAWPLLSRLRHASGRSVPVVATGGLALGVAALLVAPTAWTQITLGDTQTGAIIQAGPQSGGYGFGGAAPAGRAGGFGAAEGDTGALLAFLESHAGGTKYLLVTTNSNTAAPYIIRSGANVISLGGFSGTDRIVTQAQLASLVQKGEMRYFLLEGGGFGGGMTGTSSAAAHVPDVCTAVPASRWGGTSGRGTQLYDCAGKGAALARAAGG